MGARGTRTTHFLLYCSAITSHLIPTIPLLYCINSSLLTAIYTARQLCAFRSLRQHASHLFYETITGSYCLATPEPSPPSSSTKAGRLFGKGGIGHALRRQTAGQFGPDLAKKLSQLVKMEKNVMRSMEQVGRERMEVAQQLSIWGEACDDDVSDVTDKLGVLIYEIGELEDQYIDRYDQYRVTIKS